MNYLVGCRICLCFFDAGNLDFTFPIGVNLPFIFFAEYSAKFME